MLVTAESPGTGWQATSRMSKLASMGTSEYDVRTRETLRSAHTATNAALQHGDHPEAKRVLADGIRELRDVKRELVEAERVIRAQFQDARLKNREAGQLAGMILGTSVRTSMARARAAEGRRISAVQADVLAPYAASKAYVDRAIADLARAKARVTDDAARMRETGGPSVLAASVSVASSSLTVIPNPPLIPASWRADPTRRHELRYWDSSAWTEHVADQGVVSIDPIQ